MPQKAKAKAKSAKAKADRAGPALDDAAVKKWLELALLESGSNAALKSRVDKIDLELADAVLAKFQKKIDRV